MGSSSPNRTYYNVGINFKGELSELNIWTAFLSLNELISITQTCGRPNPIPNVLNWSNEVRNSNVTGKHHLKNINQLCSLKTAKISYFRVMPNLADQEGALKTCQILGGVLLSPKNIEEFRSWNSKCTN